VIIIAKTLGDYGIMTKALCYGINQVNLFRDYSLGKVRIIKNNPRYSTRSKYCSFEHRNIAMFKYLNVSISKNRNLTKLLLYKMNFSTKLNKKEPILFI
jgi:hypothetical protein